MEEMFVRKYARLLVDYCLAFKPENNHSKKIVYFVPAECQDLQPFLENEIENSGYKAINKETINTDIPDLVLYIGIVGDNLKTPLYSQEIKRKQYFHKAHVLLSPFPTQLRAQLAGISFDEYVEDFKDFTFLESIDPIQAWKERLAEVERRRDFLTALQIKKIKVISDSVDLEFEIGAHRKWLGASGRNIPSFETFISPDWRTVNGTIRCNLPVNKYGKSFQNIHFTFKHGELVEHTSTHLSEFDRILSQKNMTHVGEFSLTDKHISPIKRYLGSSILDENIGGQFGNMHIALGKSYIKSYDAYKLGLQLNELANLGFNDSDDHIDFVNTESKEVYASSDKGEFLLYKDGLFNE